MPKKKLPQREVPTLTEALPSLSELSLTDPVRALAHLAALELRGNQTADAYNQVVEANYSKALELLEGPLQRPNQYFARIGGGIVAISHLTEPRINKYAAPFQKHVVVGDITATLGLYGYASRAYGGIELYASELLHSLASKDEVTQRLETMKPNDSFYAIGNDAIEALEVHAVLPLIERAVIVHNTHPWRKPA